MTVLRCLFAAILGLAYPAAVRALDEIEVSGRVLDADGKPAAGVGVAERWAVNRGKTVPYRGTVTDAEGRFTLRLLASGRKLGLMARDKNDKTGGLVLMGDKPPDKPVQIKLVPLIGVKGRFFCKELGKPAPVSLLINTDKARVFGGGAPDGWFSFRLPPGTYQMWTAALDYQKVEKTFTLKAGSPDVDLQVVDVPPSILTKLQGKEPPKWHVTDARGVKKTVQLSDYKGKWVLLDFWAYWCGPCVIRSLPTLIDLYEVHEKDRDQFAILTFHNTSVKDFSELDKKLENTRARFWKGKDLPLPILLDSTGETIKHFGIEHFPTLLLIDPEGKLVGEVSEEEFAAKLPALPMSVRVDRALDRPTSFALYDPSLAKLATYLSEAAHVPIRLDKESLKQAGLTPQTRTPFTMTAAISLRSVLNLTLEAHDLTYESDDRGLVIRRRMPSTAPRQPKAIQRAQAKRIESALDRKVSFAFKNETLAQVVISLWNKTSENVLLDPCDRKAGTLDPQTRITGSVKELPLREALSTLLDPIGVTFTVRDEVIVLKTKRKTAPRK